MSSTHKNRLCVGNDVVGLTRFSIFSLVFGSHNDEKVLEVRRRADCG